MGRVIYTEDSRQSSSIDVTRSVTGGQSTLFPTDTNAGDILVPRGKVAKLTGVMWMDSPWLYCASNQAVGLLIFVNRGQRMNYQRQVPVGGAVDVTQLGVGFLQGVWLPTFARLDESETLTIQLVPAGGVVLTSPRFIVQMTLSDNTGAPLNAEFTNP